MDKKLFSIGEAATMLGVSIDTLRRWDQQGLLQSFRPSLTSKRSYKKEEIERFLKSGVSGDIDAGTTMVRLAEEWARHKQANFPAQSFYCQTSDVFQARLQRMESELQKLPGLKDTFPLIVAVLGEIGNNSYNHNVGSWPDIPGIFFGYHIQHGKAVIADRGRGVRATLQRVLPHLQDDQEALEVAFTQYISGRAPEDRGNGLKFVKDVVMNAPFHLEFFSGNAFLDLQQGDTNLRIQTSPTPIGGCFSIFSF